MSIVAALSEEERSRIFDYADSLVYARMTAIMAERDVDAIRITTADELDLLLARKSLATQRYAQLMGGFINLITIFAEDRLE